MSSTFSKIALFIDGPNLYATAKALGFDIDYKRMLKEFQSPGALLRAGSGSVTVMLTVLTVPTGCTGSRGEPFAEVAV